MNRKSSKKNKYQMWGKISTYCRKNKVIIQKVIFFILFFLIILAGYSLKWASETFGNISMEEIVFTLNMPLKGAAGSIIQEYLKEALYPAAIIVGCIFIWMEFPTDKCLALNFNYRNRKMKLHLFPLHIPGMVLSLFLLASFLTVLFQADQKFALKSYVLSKIQKSDLIEKEFVAANDIQITFPEKKRNLICIYLESAESSNQDKKNGGLFETNYIPEMTQLAKENLTFSQSDLIEGSAMAPGTSWTTAGLIAQNSGVPLKVPNDSYKNAMGKQQYFLPGIVSLGEILEKEGYYNYFCSGSDFGFGGCELFFSQHGDYTVYDYSWAISEGLVPKGYYVWWGFEDYRVYENAKEVLLQVAENENPFNFNLITIDTHTPGGYVCPYCGNEYSRQYGNVWRCASRQLYDFITWCKEQDFYSNTTIYISGDHNSMYSIFYPEELDETYENGGQRKIFNTFVNAPIEPVKSSFRKFTTMDMFPTILGSLGVEIEGNRIGLGTNLFSEEETLSEKYGYPYLFKELSKKSDFYDKKLLYPPKK